VTLGGATATIDSENASYVAITVPDGDAEADGEVDIVMTSDSGAVVTEADGWTFVKSNITSVSPSQGQLGVVVTLSGTNLLGGGSSVDITFGGVDVLEIISLDNSEIVVRVADAAAGQSTVTLTADTGAVVTQANGFEYLEASDIASVTPNAGQFSTRVTIAGTSLLGEGAADDATIVSARLGTTKAEVVFANSTLVILDAADADAGTVNITLVATSGAKTVEADGWTYIELGEITAVSPSTGQFGTRVELSGARMLGGDTEAKSVTLAGVPAFVSSASASTISLIAADAADGTISCDAVCDIGYFRDTSGVVVTTVDLNLEKIVEDSFDDAQQTIFEAVLNKSLSALNSFDGLTAPVVNITALTAFSSGTGTIITLEVTTAQVLYETIADILSTVVTSSEFLASLKAESGAYYFVTAIDHDAAPSVAKGTMCKSCDGGCSGCISSFTGDIIITALSGAVVSLEDGFGYKKASQIAEVNPAAGQLGTVVTVTGAHLRGSGANVTKVTLAGVEADIQSESNTVIIVVAAAGSTSTGDVVVVADTGALATASSAFSTPRRDRSLTCRRHRVRSEPWLL